MSKRRPATEPAVLPQSLELPLTGVDSHAHLDLNAFAEDLDQVLTRAEETGLAAIGNVFLSPEAWQTGKSLFANRQQVFFLLGIHPTDARAWNPRTRDAVARAFAEDPRLRALGEIGLDFYWKDCPPEAQRAAFAGQLALAQTLSRPTADGSDRREPLPVVIHSRDAFAETVAMLQEQGFSGYPLLWHCFGGGPDEAAALVEKGWHISIPGPVTFKSNDRLRAALRAIPLSRMLLETDCPYLAPVPYRGKRNEPAYTAFTAQAVARELDMEPAELWTLCGANARRFFGLPDIIAT